ncbi:protein ECT2 isoform X2 [Spodoptera frugiperda]|uniref:Protein ECT2 isoform X2 n=1 Tax=Spodoptera frugiperda TaxID=7108 RepID=A0A9R0CV12_SPOFR|nr:protein ECT2 isoform X2 [Spodoptera frugiperda]
MDELSKGMTQTGNTATTDKIQENDDGSSTSVVYVNETCLECERVRAACERLGTVAVAPSPEALPPAQQTAAPPSYVITSPFEGDLFDTAHRAKYRVLGPTAVLQLSERDEPPPATARPLYSLAMRGAVICFSGFRKKDELTYLITLIHYMGGSIRKDMSSKVTHLIAAAATGDKYRYASGFGLPVLARSWVDACWERRDDPACLATDDDIIKEHKLKVFAGARVCFVGFPEDETQHMAEVLASNGGGTCQLDDPDCTHVVMANGETFGRSLILSPHPSTPNSAKPSRATPNRSQSTPKSSLYRRLSARLSGRRASPTKHANDMSHDDREQRLHIARNSIRDKQAKAVSKDQTDDSTFSISLVGKSFTDDLYSNFENNKSPQHVERAEMRKYTVSDKENNKNLSQLVHGSDKVNSKDKREVFRNKSMNVFNLVDCLTEAGSLHSSLTKSLCDLDAKDEPVFLLASSTGGKELQQSTTTISSGKKRSRNSTDSNFQVSTVDANLSPDKCEESNWKSIKRLKIKDSFKFKNRPTIFKRTKKDSVSKTTGEIVVEPVSPDSVKPTDPAGEFIASTSSPIKEDDNTSICSMNTSKQSGFFDISFASIRSSKTVKSASKLRRSVKSFTASFRSERKKKYEKRAERNTVEVDASHLPSDLKNISTPKQTFDGMNLDISPVQVDTVDSTGLVTPIRNRVADADELDDSTVFKTPQSVWLRTHRHSICGGSELRLSSAPSVASASPCLSRCAAPTSLLPLVSLAPPSSCSARDQPPPASTPPIRDAHAISQCHGISLPVVDEHNIPVAPDCSTRVHVVKAEWFWASVQNEEAQDERDYLFKDYLDEVSRRSSVGGACAGVTAEEAAAATPSTEAGATPSHLQRLRKRKLRGGESALHKRRSSVGDAVLLSLSGNLLDCTPSPDGKQLLEESEVPDTVVRKLLSPRQQVFMELLQTESNYVGILHTIVTMFKQPLEEMTEDDNSNGKNQALLNNTELKIIFGNLPPIYELHQRMLEELRYAQAHWSEETSIGRLVLRYTPDMVKAYPPFVNFFENTKEMLQQCDRENPRFHAFLKICQTKPECGRQSLQELLIRPVQRLPSISLLLDDILKHTHKNNPDHGALVQALAGLREVMSHINEDKRKTEGQLQMFDIYNDIDQCPAHLVSSHRSFVSRCEVVELSKELSGRGDHLVLFLFTDTMEVCKKRSKAFNSKSPTNGTGTMRIGSSKPYRHISLMPLSTVKRVVDIREAEDCHNVFALMCRNNQELKEKLFSFMITDETVDKSHFLRQLCRQMANTVCKADADKFLACLESHQLDIDTSELALSTLSKVSKFAARTRIKLEALAGLTGLLRPEPGSGLLDTWVGRAFSFNKTPSKLKRAMSSMISPFGSTSNLTPASQLAQMRLASCNNINEMGTSGGGAGGGGEVLVAPLSVQPTRKAAPGAALRRF